jgi:arylsulfatase A-like enzyme
MVPEQLDTVPELLSEVGYRTVGISDMAHVSSTYGFDRGFDAFYGPDTRTVPDLSSKLGLLQYPAIVTEGLRQAIWNADAARDGYPLLKTVPLLTNEVIKREVKRATARDRNYFIYAHYISPHNPYEPPAGFADQFLKNAGLDREAALETSQKWLSSRDSLHEISANEARLTNNQWEQLIALYDGELNWVDRYVSQLLDALSPIPEDTVVIVTSDHGELLGERGIATHKYTEIFEEYPHHDMSKYHTGQVNAIRCEEFKLLDGDNRQTLYNIPDEETDVSEAHPDVTAQLESELEDWRATIGNGIEIEATADLTDKVKYQLERLGYK